MKTSEKCGVLKRNVKELLGHRRAECPAGSPTWVIVNHVTITYYQAVGLLLAMTDESSKCYASKDLSSGWLTEQPTSGLIELHDRPILPACT